MTIHITLLRLLTIQFYGYSIPVLRLHISTYMDTHITLLRLPTIHFYSYSHSTSTATHSPLLRLLQYNSSTSTHNPRLIRLITINFYGYLQYISSTTTHNTLLPRLPTTVSTTSLIPRLLWLLKSTSCAVTHNPLSRILTIRFYGYSEPLS